VCDWLDNHLFLVSLKPYSWKVNTKNNTARKFYVVNFSRHIIRGSSDNMQVHLPLNYSADIRVLPVMLLLIAKIVSSRPSVLTTALSWNCVTVSEKAIYVCGGELQVHSFIFCTLDRGEWSISLPGRFASSTLWINSRVSPRVDLDVLKKSKSLAPGGNRTTNHPAHSLVTKPTALLRIPRAMKCLMYSFRCIRHRQLLYWFSACLFLDLI
jgi:hypothetical protein